VVISYSSAYFDNLSNDITKDFILNQKAKNRFALFADILVTDKFVP
jgi:hypothetical protein